MEHEALVFEGTWSTFDPSMSVGDSEVMKQYLYGAHSVTNEQDQDPSIMLCSDHSAHSYCSDNTDYNRFYWPQGNSSISTASACSYLFPLDNYGGSYNVSDHNMGLAASISSVPVEDLRIGEGQITAPSFPVDPYHQFNQPVCMTEEISSNEVGESFEKPPFLLLPSHHSCKATKKRRSICDFEMPEMTRGEDCQIVSPKKKARAFTSVPKKAKNAKSKKVQKSARTTNEEESNVDTNAQSSSCYSSEDDSNGSQELNGSSTTNSNSNKSAALNLHAKTRAVHGSASDPQSLYARKRRERINERLRILQKLIPNGTKVDISTMLEEAVQYVKFLQLQIKLLSSDDLWMYAPIAYNGMNIGFDVKISPSSQK